VVEPPRAYQLVYSEKSDNSYAIERPLYPRKQPSTKGILNGR